MESKVFVDGMIFKLPSEKAPDFIKGKLSIKVEEFMAFMLTNEKKGWLNIEMKIGQSGKPYCELDTWEPNQGSGRADNPVSKSQGKSGHNDIPFNDDTF